MGSRQNDRPTQDVFTCKGGNLGVSRLLQCLGLILLAGVVTAAAEIPAELTLSQAVDLALAQNASLAAASAGVASTMHLERQAGYRPNPAFALQSENWRWTGEPPFKAGQDLDIYAYFSQPIEMGGKRSRRVQLAQQDTQIAELERKATEWRIRQNVRHVYLKALLAQTQLELIAENNRNFQQVIEFNRIRVEQGATAEADLIRVKLEGDRLKVAEDIAALELDQARMELIRGMGLTAPVSLFRLVPPPEASPEDTVPALPELLQLAHSNRIEVQLAQAAVERARTHLNLQESLAKPDVNAVFGYKRVSGYDTLLAGMMVPLPIFNRNTGNIASSTSEIERTQSQRQAVLAQVDADVAGALAGLQKRQLMLHSMQKGMLDRAEQSAQIALAAYQEGGSDLLRLLDAQRVRNEARLLYMQTRMEFRLSQVELESAVGTENIPGREESPHVDY
jgi:outer membrane protein, heavy metal efflux system